VVQPEAKSKGPIEQGAGRAAYAVRIAKRTMNGLDELLRVSAAGGSPSPQRTTRAVRATAEVRFFAVSNRHHYRA